MASAPIRTKAHCNNCGGYRNHEVLHVEKSEWIDEEQGYSGSDTYEMLKCSGCESIKLCHTSYFSEDELLTTTYFPPSVFRQEPRWFRDLSLELGNEEENVHNLLKEVYVALQNNQKALAAMGVRALLEHIMVAKCGDNGSFAKNLEQFEKAGFVSQIQRQSLETILEAGHATIHRAFRPSRDDLVTLVDIAESIVEGVYVHGPKVERLKKRIPSRATKKPS
jgi:hypothetical protein